MAALTAENVQTPYPPLVIGGGSKKAYILWTGIILFKSVKLVLYSGLEAHKPNVDKKDNNKAS